MFQCSLSQWITFYPPICLTRMLSHSWHLSPSPPHPFYHQGQSTYTSEHHLNPSISPHFHHGHQASLRCIISSWIAAICLLNSLLTYTLDCLHSHFHITFRVIFSKCKTRPTSFPLALLITRPHTHTYKNLWIHNTAFILRIRNCRQSGFSLLGV